jgi:Na+/H+ antiporter NhaC
MASATDHIDHVRTQLPYALLAAAISAVGFFILGLFA